MVPSAVVIPLQMLEAVSLTPCHSPAKNVAIAVKTVSATVFMVFQAFVKKVVMASHTASAATLIFSQRLIQNSLNSSQLFQR